MNFRNFKICNFVRISYRNHVVECLRSEMMQEAPKNKHELTPNWPVLVSEKTTSIPSFWCVFVMFCSDEKVLRSLGDVLVKKYGRKNGFLRIWVSYVEWGEKKNVRKTSRFRAFWASGQWKRGMKRGLLCVTGPRYHMNTKFWKIGNAGWSAEYLA